jgi:hypothetical protein
LRRRPMRRLCLVTFAVGAVLTATPGAQARPDFSGTWVASTPGGFPSEHRVTITQDATTITIDSTALRIFGRTDGVQSSASSTSYPVRTAYILDGREHPREMEPPAAVPVSTRGFAARLEESVIRASRAGSQIVVMKYDTYRMASPNHGETRIRKTTRESLTLAADGTLEWEILTLSDPIPGGGETPTPTPMRRVFKRS